LSKQGEFQAIIDHADRQWWTRIDTFARANRQRYLDFGAFITPCDFTTEEVFKRLAFSILSVKTPFDRACGAFAKVMKLPARERVHKRSLMRATDDVMYRTVKVRALQEAWKLALQDPSQFKRREHEPWHDYRMGLERLHGLGKAKATFAACLLYPLDADLACLDTWMLKQFGLDARLNGRMSWDQYQAVEEKVRAHARRWKVGTFIAQWMIWDHARGSIESHATVALPGGHK